MKLILVIQFERTVDLRIEDPAYVPSVGHMIFHRYNNHRVVKIQHSFDDADAQVIYVITETSAN